MKQSLHARRMANRHKRAGKGSKLNLVALMDIFTILVFFLLVNSSDVEVLQTNKDIDLPESLADKIPEPTLVVMISADSIIINGRAIVPTQAAMNTEGDLIEPLRQELEYLAGRKPYASDEERERGRDITIMGDARTPYNLMKKIMSTCAQSEYRNISLAVNQTAPEEPTVEAGG